MNFAAYWEILFPRQWSQDLLSFPQFFQERENIFGGETGSGGESRELKKMKTAIEGTVGARLNFR